MKCFASRVIALLAAAFAYAGLAVSPALAQQAGWTEMLGNSAHTSYAPDSAVSTSNAATFGVRWMANLYNADLGSPVVAYNSVLGKYVVYAGNERGDVFAVDATTGAIVWSTNIGVNDKVEDTPMVAPDGSVWVGTSYNATMYKLNGATGAVQCSVKAPLPIDASPITALPSGGVQSVYWGTIDTSNILGPVFGNSEADCSQIFKFTNYINASSSGTWTTPAFGVSATGEPLIFVGTADSDSAEYAIDAITGNRVWSYQVENPPPSTYDIGDGATVSAPGNNGFADGVVYVGTKYGDEYALDLTTGTELWMYHFGKLSRASAALDGTSLVFGYANGVYALNAINGSTLWQYATPAEVLSSPAIIGPSGSEVVTFGDLTGAFRILSLSGGSQIYKYQTGGYITSSPAEANGQVFMASSDGFLYSFAPGGGNAPPPSTTIASPVNQSTLPNPNGSIVVTGSSTDATAVNSVEIAVQSGGTSGPWYNASTSSYGSAPIRNQATLVSPGAAATSWSFSFPAPPAGGTFRVFANTVNSSNIVDRGTITAFTVQPSKSEPNLTLSTGFVPPGSSLKVSGAGFAPSEQVTFTLFGNTVATATASSLGKVGKTTIKVPSSATFGPTSITATGLTSGKSSTGSLFVTNNWTQFAHDPARSGQEQHDPVINASLSIGNNTVLNQSWYYQAGAAVNSSPVVVNGVAYFGNDAGVLSAVVNNTGAPAWTYKTPSGAPIQSAPAVDPKGHVLFGSTDGNLYTVSSAGVLVQTLSLGGNLTSPNVDNGQIFVSSDSGKLFAVSDTTGSLEWTATLGGASHSSPSYDPVSNVVIVGDDSGAVTAFNGTTGAQVWQTVTGGAVKASPAINKGVVYVGSADSYFYALNETTGAQQWRYQTTGPIVATAALYGNNISVGDGNGSIFSLTPSGGVQYAYATPYKGKAIVGVTNVTGPNTLFETASGTVAMVRLVGGRPFIAWYYTSSSALSTEPAIVDGTVYVGAADGGVYAFTPQGANPLSKTRGPTITITDANGWSCSTTP